MEQSPGEKSPARPDTPNVFSSLELSGVHTRRMITISFVAYPVPKNVTIESVETSRQFQIVMEGMNS